MGKRFILLGTLLSIILVLLAQRSSVCEPLPAELKGMILRYHLENPNNSPFYNGEAGPLSIVPEIASKAGLNVYVDEHLNAARLYKKEGGRYRKLALDLFQSVSRQEASALLLDEIIDYVLQYKKYMADSRNEYILYQQNLEKNRRFDQRFNEDMALKVIDFVFEESIKVSNRLRDVLAIFYNRLRGVDEDETITKANVYFVNYFFSVAKSKYKSFLRTSQLDIENTDRTFDIERSVEILRNLTTDKRIADAIIESASKLNISIDPLIFFTLIKRESNLNQYAVSPVGAVGLTQIMPSTAKSLGMKGIYEPEYLKTCVSIFKDANTKRDKAYEILFSIERMDDKREVIRAVEMMKESLELRRRHSELIKRYKRELMEKGTDERVLVEGSVYNGMKYFYQQLKTFDHDLSLALSAYNAGPGKVVEYNGVPPFGETIKYRNWIIENYYKIRATSVN